jgi:hypothetical protein
MIDKQIASRPANRQTSVSPICEAAEQQQALAAELVDDARQLTARARQLLAQRRAERAAVTGIGIAMLNVGRAAGTVVSLPPVIERQRRMAA